MLSGGGVGTRLEFGGGGGGGGVCHTKVVKHPSNSNMAGGFKVHHEWQSDGVNTSPNESNSHIITTNSLPASLLAPPPPALPH